MCNITNILSRSTVTLTAESEVGFSALKESYSMIRAHPSPLRTCFSNTMIVVCAVVVFKVVNAAVGVVVVVVILVGAATAIEELKYRQQTLTTIFFLHADMCNRLRSGSWGALNMSTMQKYTTTT